MTEGERWKLIERETDRARQIDGEGSAERWGEREGGRERERESLVNQYSTHRLNVC